MASRLEGRLVRLERLSGAPVATGKPDAPCECWRWLTGVMEIPTPEPEPGEAMGAWLNRISDDALGALDAWHYIGGDLKEIDRAAGSSESDPVDIEHIRRSVRAWIAEHRPQPAWRRPRHETP